MREDAPRLDVELFNLCGPPEPMKKLKIKTQAPTCVVFVYNWGSFVSLLCIVLIFYVLILCRTPL